MAEKEYIEREKALDFISEVEPIICMPPDNKPTFTAVKDPDMVAYLESIPASDVRPVVKAHWLYTDMSRLVCSNCGNPVAFALKDDGWHHGDFCPKCGAMMEES